MRSSANRRGAFACSLESLEYRRVLSGVSVMPHQIAMSSITHGHGVATVVVLGDSNLDVSTIDAASLTLTATPSGGTSPQTLQLKGSPQVEDTNGDGSPDLVLHFTRSQLKGLTGQVTLDVQGTTTSGDTTSDVTDFGSGTLTIFTPGHQGQGGQNSHGHSTHHGPGSLPTQTHGHGHTSGQQPTQGQNHPHGPGH